MGEKYDFLIVGAGFSGAVLAERLAASGKKILIIDARDHIGGNCHDYRSGDIIVQKYGPHIFHTSEKKVADYLARFTKLTDYKHRVMANHQGKLYPIPINRDTINKFYDLDLKTEEEVIAFLEGKKLDIETIENSRDVVVSKFGEELYDAFIKNFTKKQWDKYPEELDKSILERLPIRYSDKFHYFDDEHQGMPDNGFSALFSAMLDSENIEIMLGTRFEDLGEDLEYSKLIFTGRIDSFFDYKHGKLDYRCINFVFDELDQEFYQDHPVVNYPGDDVGFSRITEYKRFHNTPSKKTMIGKEFFTWEGEAAYPVLDPKNKETLGKYTEEANGLKDVFFVGRLAEFKYYNMDKAILRALEVFDEIKCSEEPSENTENPEDLETSETTY
jgi:UDP-galactopyranose mutase